MHLNVIASELGTVAASELKCHLPLISNATKHRMGIQSRTSQKGAALLEGIRPVTQAKVKEVRHGS